MIYRNPKKYVSLTPTRIFCDAFFTSDLWKTVAASSSHRSSVSAFRSVYFAENAAEKCWGYCDDVLDITL